MFQGLDHKGHEISSGGVLQAPGVGVQNGYPDVVFANKMKNRPVHDSSEQSLKDLIRHTIMFIAAEKQKSKCNKDVCKLTRYKYFIRFQGKGLWRGTRRCWERVPH